RECVSVNDAETQSPSSDNYGITKLRGVATLWPVLRWRPSHFAPTSVQKHSAPALQLLLSAFAGSIVRCRIRRRPHEGNQFPCMPLIPILVYCYENKKQPLSQDEIGNIIKWFYRVTLIMTNQDQPAGRRPSKLEARGRRGRN